MNLGKVKLNKFNPLKTSRAEKREGEIPGAVEPHSVVVESDPEKLAGLKPGDRVFFSVDQELRYTVIVYITHQHFQPAVFRFRGKGFGEVEKVEVCEGKAEIFLSSGELTGTVERLM